MGKRTKRWVILITVMVMLLASACSQAETKTAVKSDGFDTPEAAVEAFLQELKATNLEAMINTFAIENYVENYDLEAYLDRIKTYTYTQEIKLPNASDFVTSLNIESRKSTVSNAILNLCFALGYVELDRSGPIMLREDGEAADFVAQLADRFSRIDFNTLEIVGFIAPEKLAEMYESEAGQANMARQAAIYGANQLTSCVIIFEVDGDKILLCMDVAEYGGKWYNLQIGGTMAQYLYLSTFMGGILPLNPEYAGEFSSRISDML